MKQFKETLQIILLIIGLVGLVILGFTLEVLLSILLAFLFGAQVVNWLLLILLVDLALCFFFYTKLFAPEPDQVDKQPFDDEYDSWHD